MQGLILLDKPNGITSFSAVAAIKRLTGQKRVGHTGTLDPMATGVLPVLLGRATALSSLLLDGEKRYIARVKLGITTDTDDITGEVISESKVGVGPQQLQSALCAFTGEISQVPPMYSAIKKDGIRLYKLAREGKTAEIDARRVNIFEINLLSGIDSENTFVIETHVSKGTYIRSLARDIGEYLGCGATLAELRRTYASGFDIADSVELEKLNSDNISQYIFSEEKSVEHLPALEVTEKQAIRFCNGGQLSFERLHITDALDEQLYRMKSNGLFLGVGFADLAREQIGVRCIINYPEW